MGDWVDENCPNATTSRPTEPAFGSSTRWFQDRNPAGGVTGTTVQARWMNWWIGNLRSLAAATGVTISPNSGGDTNLQSMLEAISSKQRRGQLEAELIWVSSSQVRLRPSRGTKIAVEIDGTIVENTGNVTFDMSTDFESTETASSPIYLYLRNNSGAFERHASHTAPDLAGGTKPGYHPTNTTWRCVGTCWNDASLNIVPFVCSKGRHYLRERVSNHTHTPTIAANTAYAWTSQSLNIPKGARAVRVAVDARIEGTGGAVVFGHSDAASTLPSIQSNVTLDTSGVESARAILPSSAVSGEPASLRVSDQIDLGIADQNAPAIKWGFIQEVGTADITLLKLVVVGYDCGFSPAL